MPSPARAYHVQSKNIVCADSGTTNSCEKLHEGTWSNSHTLATGHTSACVWHVEEGFYILGGYKDGGESTTELVKYDGGVEQGFDLKYRLR